MAHHLQGRWGLKGNNCLGATSDEQGFGNPCRYMGKGTVGMGRGKDL